MATGSKSSRMTPADGLLCLTSAINRVRDVFPWSKTAWKKLRVLPSSEIRSRSSSSGTAIFAAATSLRLRRTIVLSTSVIVALGILAAKSRGEVADPSTAEPASNWPTISLALGAAIIILVLATRAMRLTYAPANEWKLSAGKSFALFALLYVTGAFGSWMLSYVCGISAGDESMKAKVIAGLGGFATQVALLFAVFRMQYLMPTFLQASTIEPAIESTRKLPAPWGTLRSIFFGAFILAIAWFPLQAVGGIVASIQLYFGGLQPPTDGHSTFDLLSQSHDKLLTCAMVVIILICAPITEEFTFRGAMQMGLRGSGFSPWWAIIFTSIFFAVFHIPVLTPGAVASGIATLFLLAVILGWLMQRTGRIAAPIAAHSLFNFTNLMLFWLG